MTSRNLLTASIISIIGGSIFSVAFADNIPVSTYCHPGFYVGLQGGRTDTYYSPNEVFPQAVYNNAGVASTTTLSSPFAFSGDSASVTVNPNNLLDTETVTSITNNGLHGEEIDDIGLGGRVYAGYQFMPYFAAELGFTQFAKTTFNATGIATTNTVDTTSGPLIDTTNHISGAAVNNTFLDVNTTNTATTTQYSGDITEHAIDLVAKGTLPLPYGFGLYAKAGMAYITAERDINSHVTGNSSNSLENSQETIDNNQIGPTVTSTDSGFSNVDTFSTIYTTTYQAFRPVAGAGIDYTIPNSNFDVEGSYTRIFGSGAIDSADLLAIGVNYKFC